MKFIKRVSSVWVLVFAFLATLFFSSPSLMSADSADGQWEITADKLTRYEEPPRVVAEGNVLLEKKEPVTTVKNPRSTQWDALLGEGGKSANEQNAEETVTEIKTTTTVKADWAAYDASQSKINAQGNIAVDIGTDSLTAESGCIDVEKTTGTFEHATIIRQAQDMHLEGKIIEKTGERTYHIEDGWVVTCKLQQGETPPWSFWASDVKITDGGYAFLKHATFRIKDVPVLYAPVMLLPAKRERQTGFLFPSVSTSSRDGFGIETPFFINLSPYTDITLYPQYLSKRGMMNGAEFRYVLDENSKGMLMGNYLADALSKPSEVSYYQDGQFTHTNADRYWIRGKADQNIGAWTTRLDVDIVSDLDYLREFDNANTGFGTTQERFTEVFGRGFYDKTNKYRDNTLEFLRTWENGSSLLGEFLIVDDLSMQTYAANNPSQVWKLPSLTYSGLIPFSDAPRGPDFSWDVNYTDFWREKGVGAQRFDALPTITTGVPLTPYVEAIVSGGVRNTAYLIQGNGAADWADNDSKNRYLYNLGGEVGTTLMHDFTIHIGDVNAWSHTLRPYAAYAYTSIPDKALLPQFDSIDSLKERNILYYGVNNFFTIYGERNGREYDREYAFLKVRQGYDMMGDTSGIPVATSTSDALLTGSPLTPVEIKTGFYPLNLLRFMYTTDVDVYGKGAFLHAVEADYASGRGDLFGLDYRYNSLTHVDSVSGSAWYLLPYNFAVGYSLQRAIATNETIEEKVRLRYTQPCWSVELSANSTPGDQSFLVTFRLANIGNAFGYGISGH